MVSRASRVEVVGPLEAYQPGFQQALAGAGYTPLSALKQLQLMNHLSIWLEEQDLGAIDLSGSVVGAYLAARRADGYTSRLSVKALSPLLAYLRGLGIAPLSVTAGGAMP